MLRGWVLQRWLQKSSIQHISSVGFSRVSQLMPRGVSQGSVVPCQLCGYTQPSFLHVASVLYKKRKGKDEKKAVMVNPKGIKEKSHVVNIWKNMTVQELADAIKRDLDTLFEIFIYVEDSEEYDRPDAAIDNLKVIQNAVKRAGLRFRLASPPDKIEMTKESKDAFRRPPPDESELVRRPPVVTIMGHVDHGKTTLLDALRHSAIVDTEFGGITQHIGAFSVRLDSGEKVTFLDTPGHAAFREMRARGATVTDIVVLVVAADDGVMEQTKESIHHALEANVSIVVAINKIDKPGANVAQTRDMLLQHGLQLEDHGGDIQAVPISALKGQNLNLLVEAIVTQAELLNLCADPRGLVEAVVVESRLDLGRGKVATCIIQRGTLSKGAVLVAGTAWCKVRNLFDDAGQPVKAAPPATPVQVIGWKELPAAGDLVLEVESERCASEVVEWRRKEETKEKQEQQQEAIQEKLNEHLAVYKAQLEEKRRLGIRVKRATLPAGGKNISVYLENWEILEFQLFENVIATCLEILFDYGSIYTFNTEIPADVQKMAKDEGVSIKKNNVIYHLVEDLKIEISQNLPPKDIEEILGEANVIEEFLITERKKKVPVAGCRCVRGVLKKEALYRVIRGQDIIHEGLLSSMYHIKSEVATITRGKECGLKFVDELLRFQPGDTLVCYQMNKVSQVTDWDPGF
ncbi:translation initiation factor IF-2, mitochondrial [Cherax quadricarinatus]